VTERSEVLPGIETFMIPVEQCEALLHQISLVDEKIPNSMHRYGKVLLPAMTDPITEIIRTLLPSSEQDQITHIHAFYI
jgi:hypothetical protein